MTVIKAFSSEKKSDNAPLVDNAVLPAQDVESGSINEDCSTSTGSNPHLLMMNIRAKRASAITTLLLIATTSLVLTIGICGGFYIYKQFTHARFQNFKAFCNVPYYDEYSDQVSHGNVFQDKLVQNSDVELLDGFQKMMEKGDQLMKNIFEAPKREEDLMFSVGAPKRFPEEFEMDLDLGTYEKIHVPEFQLGRNSKFVHDFHANMTGIIDLHGGKCFVMPLNKTAVLPPTSLFDLIQKMASGYYAVNPSQVVETYRAIETPMDDLSSLGEHIQAECRDFPVYRLEKAVGGIVKRSVDSAAPAEKPFVVLDGQVPRAIEIININEVSSVKK